VAEQLTFHPYARSDLFEKVTSVDHGRAVASITVTLRDAPTGDTRSAPLSLHLMGPADTAGLQPSAVVHSAPKPWTRDAEITKLAHVDFGDVDLPWRYSFELRTGNPPATAANRPKPWIVLITGTTDELELIGGGVRFKSDAVLAAHDLDRSWLWAHEMEDAGRKVSRLTSPRGLETTPPGLIPNHEYIAVVVPAYALVGGNVLSAWEAHGNALLRPPEGNTLPAYYSWHYWTAEAGDFRTLAKLLHAVEVGGLGRSRLAYERVAGPPVLEVRGAITSLAPSTTTQVAPIPPPPDVGLPTTWPIATDPAPADVLADFNALNAELKDADGRREVLGLPTYGIPWIAEPKDTDWGRLLNGDPRFRGIAGLGAWLAMEAQEELIDAARQQVGALGEASQRVRQLALGLGAARSLWTRRLPADPVQQLYLFGPTLRRLPASDGVNGNLLAMDVVTGSARSLPRNALSSAARRMLRPDDGVVKHAQPGAADRAALLRAANECPPAPVRSSGHVDNLLEQVDMRPLGELLGVVDMPEQVRQVVEEIVAQGQPINSDAVAERLFGALNQTLGVPGFVLTLLRQRLAPYHQTVVSREILVDVVLPFLARLGGFGQGQGEGGADLVVELVQAMRPLERPCRLVDLAGLGRLVADAISPMGPKAPALVRVCTSVTGIDVCNMEPPEVCVGLNYEVWKLLRQKAKAWLLPGIEDLEKNAVVAMESNPAFVEALLVGLNTRLLAELRWHNLAIAPKCTPLRWFWGNFDYKTDKRVDDIHGIDLWKDTRLGDKQHQVLDPGDPAGNRDLVMVFRTDLFRRYPSTLVYLTKKEDDAALALETPDFVGRRAIAPRIKGTVSEDVTFFVFDIDPSTLPDYRVVLDEPPAELRFRNDLGSSADDGAAFAAKVIDTPIRVAIEGTYLNWKGLPA
jgi:hypothetical protein